MKRPHTQGSPQLRTLERWRTVELENAQAEYAQLLRIALEKRSMHGRIGEQIVAAQAEARDLLSGATLSVEVMQRLHAFASRQACELQAAQVEVEKSQEKLEAGRDNLLQHFERLAVVERFKERRERQVMKQTMRVDQKQLDEHALTRAHLQGSATDHAIAEE